MYDFFRIAEDHPKSGGTNVYPAFQLKYSDDIMIRGKDFYALWLPDVGRWTTSEFEATEAIDNELYKYAKENEERLKVFGNIRVLPIRECQNDMVTKWHRYVQKDMRDSYVPLDETLVFANDPISKEMYSSHRLPYALCEGPIDGWDMLVSTLYSPEERHKIEWSIGSIVTGASKSLQKFCVFYGEGGTGKSTILNIIEKLFEGYTCTFDAKSLGSASSQFALEPFKNGPLVAIQHDGDLSRIEDNTRLNSLVSHEVMLVNEKFKGQYPMAFKCFLFMGTNRPVSITDSKSGLIRRLIDIRPTGNKLDFDTYTKCMNLINTELGAIAWHCKEVFLDNPNYYDAYKPTEMMVESNDMYNFVLECSTMLDAPGGISGVKAYEYYKQYCDSANVQYVKPKRRFIAELKDYYNDYKERGRLADGTQLRDVFIGLNLDKLMSKESKKTETEDSNWIELHEGPSLLDEMLKDCPAQYSKDGHPAIKWDLCKTTMKDISTDMEHWVKPEVSHIVVDFDFKDSDGNKDLSRNIEAANKWPKTYAETSKSGGGLHLHYIYTGDPLLLEPRIDEHTEVKVYSGNTSLRRRLYLHNDIPVANITSGLPLRKEKSVVVSEKSIKSEKTLRAQIEKALNKEIGVGSTAPCVSYIKKILDECYESGMSYDVTDMAPRIAIFASKSSNQKTQCLKMVSVMKFKSSEDTTEETVLAGDIGPLIFYDIEVFPNLLLIDWKMEGPNAKKIRMFNPQPDEVMKFINSGRLVGFNNRNYDNHIIYGRAMGDSIEQCYQRSQDIINGERGSSSGKIGKAYNISYADVYDFSTKKQSLKKFEIELGIKHHELGLPWDQPVPEELWPTVADYCDDDVDATEAVFNYRKADFTARSMLADIAGMTPNDTTNSLTNRIIFDGNKSPQNEFNYRFMGDTSLIDEDKTREMIEASPIRDIIINDPFTKFNSEGKPVYPGYKFEFPEEAVEVLDEDGNPTGVMSKKKISTYRGEIIGEGGYVWSRPGIYYNVPVLDIASMHPTSIICENLFGDRYTKRFEDIKNARVFIKHNEFDKCYDMLGGKLKPYLANPAQEVIDNLPTSLKIPINSTYGLTSAGFSNPFRDPRNEDNIVAKRGALFMVNLKHIVEGLGYVAAHIKTDSIKIPNADDYIINVVMEYGKLYGYTFEHESTYEKMCLIDKAQYIAKYNDESRNKHPGEWTATGKLFAVPYIFKSLFTHEPISIEDYAEVRESKTNIYLDYNEDMGEDEHNYQFIGKVSDFYPVRPGAHGGLLKKDKKVTDDTKVSVTDTGDYRFLEGNVVRAMENPIDILDMTFYDAKISAARDCIDALGGYDNFVNS